MSERVGGEKGASCNHSFIWRHPADNFVPPVAFAHLAPCSRCGLLATAAPVVGSASITTHSTDPEATS